ncbi:MAG: HAMP domain-containing methyl-accepting chemotaxis protein [Bacteroidota bacterium]
MKIKTSLLIAFSVLIGFTAAIYFVGNSSLNQMNNRLNRVADSTAQKIKLGARLNQDILRISREEKNLIFSRSKEDMDDYANMIEETKDIMLQRQEEITPYLDDEGRKAMADFNVVWDDYLEVLGDIIAYAYAGIGDYSMGVNSTQLAYGLSNNEARELREDAETKLKYIVDKNDQELEDDKVISDQNFQKARTTSLILLFVALAISVLIAWWIIKTVTSGLTHINRAVTSVAKGDFSVTVKEDRTDEIGDVLKQVKLMVQRLKYSVSIANEVADGRIRNAGQMVEKTEEGDLDSALKQMVINLNESIEIADLVSKGNLTVEIKKEGELETALKEMVENLKNIVEDIVSSADNIASAATQMSSTSQELSQGSNEQASSVEQVSSSMEEMVSNIQQNTDNAQQTEKIAVNASEGIKEGSKATNTAVESMKNIAEKIKIINDIAFQTNILALNAAVEAARAGEHGKGFAVVAAEVRKLAERSKIAADEIDELSANGVQVAEKAGLKLGEIVPEIEKTANLVQEIAAASTEQNSGASQINNAIQQLNTITQQSASASEELATSAEELSGQSDLLRNTIMFFTVDNSNKNKNSYVKKSIKKQSFQKESPVPMTSTGVNIDLKEFQENDNGYEKF